MRHALRLVDVETPVTFHSVPRPASKLAHILANGLWWALGNEGFHPGKDAARNDNIRSGLAERMEAFRTEQGLCWDYETVRPDGILDHYFGPRRSKSKPYLRTERIALERVNYLTLIAALYMLKQYFHGLPAEQGIEAWKREVVWLLKGFGYMLQSDQIVLCPLQTDWSENESLWLYVANYHAQEQKYKTAPKRPEFNPDACATCPVMCRVPQK